MNKIGSLFWNKNFLTYIIVGLGLMVLQVALLWLLIDIFHIKTIISSVMVIGGLFILKYILYKITGFTG